MDAGQVATVAISLVGVLAVGVLVPVFLLSRTEKHRIADQQRSDQLHREDRDAEWARQDLVVAKAAKAAEDLATSQKEIADKAAEAAALLLARQDATAASAQEVAIQAARAAELLLATNKEVADTASITNAKLDTIHTLVNSNMTAAIQAEYKATVRELAMMREVIALKQAAGLEPIREAIEAISVTEQRLRELAQVLADRTAAQEQAVAELKAGASPEALADPAVAKMLGDDARGQAPDGTDLDSPPGGSETAGEGGS